MALGTRPRIVRLVRVRHVRFMVVAVIVHPVPARREEDLRAQTVGTVVVWESVGFGLRSAVVVQACVAPGVGFQCVFVFPVHGVAGDHAEVWGWCEDGGVVWVLALAALLAKYIHT